jgi:hypothetical protein
MRHAAIFVLKGFLCVLCTIAVAMVLMFFGAYGMLFYYDSNGTLADHMSKDQSCMVSGTPPKGCPGNRAGKSN